MSAPHFTAEPIQKNGHEELRTTVESYGGRDILNLRVWFRSPDGTMMPGKQGIGLRLELLPDFIDRLQQARDAAEAQGLLGGRKAA